MAGFILKLAPNEQVLINGALVQNGDRRTKISVLSDAKILRLKDAILEREASKSPLHEAIFSYKHSCLVTVGTRYSVLPIFLQE